MTARLLWLARPVWGRLALAVLAGTGAAGASIGLMATSAWLIARAAQHPPVLYLMVAIVAVRAFGLGRGVLRYAERLAGHDAALRLLAELRARCYARLTRLAPAGLPSDGRLGDLLARFVTDLDEGVDVLVRAVLPYAVAALAGAGSVLLLGTLLPGAGAVLAVGLLLVALGVPALRSVAARRVGRRLAPLRADLAAGTVSLLHGLPDLVAYGAADPALAALADTDQRLRRATARGAGGLGLGAGLVVLAGGGCVLAALALGAAAHGLDPVLLAVVVLTPLAVFDALGALPDAAAQLGTGRAALRRVFTLLTRPDPVPDPACPAPLPAPPYHLRVEDVTARWHPDGPDVLDRFSLSLAPGEVVALVGPSGCGKSTLAALLARFLDPVAGRVTLNGIDLRELTGDQVRTAVGLVGEDAWLFDNTIEANLRVGRPDASVAELRSALAGARLLDWVDGLPQGLGTPVGEHGAKLSGGQRRRLALARALLADPPVLVLDEPTEHLDEATAHALTDELLGSAGETPGAETFAELLDATRGRTVLLITHRRYGLDRVDRVVSLC
jgi:ATP-binding cassette subfamily C protein CydC